MVKMNPCNWQQIILLIGTQTTNLKVRDDGELFE